MAAKLTHDLVLKVGEYTDRTGQTRARTKRIGNVFTKEDGSFFLSLDATVIAMETQYIANKEQNDKILVSVYSAQEGGARGEGSGAKPAAASPAPARPAPAKPADAPPLPADIDDDLPF